MSTICQTNLKICIFISTFTEHHLCVTVLSSLWYILYECAPEVTHSSHSWKAGFMRILRMTSSILLGANKTPYFDFLKPRHIHIQFSQELCINSNKRSFHANWTQMRWMFSNSRSVCVKRHERNTGQLQDCTRRTVHLARPQRLQ